MLEMIGFVEVNGSQVSVCDRKLSNIAIYLMGHIIGMSHILPTEL